VETIEFTVPGISCGHCVAAIERAVGAVPGVRTVKGDVETKHVTVAFAPPADRAAIVAAMAAEDYPPAEA
jgi:copper ion binding protein